MAPPWIAPSQSLLLQTSLKSSRMHAPTQLSPLERSSRGVTADGQYVEVALPIDSVHSPCLLFKEFFGPNFCAAQHDASTLLSRQKHPSRSRAMRTVCSRTQNFFSCDSSSQSLACLLKGPKLQLPNLTDAQSSLSYASPIYDSVFLEYQSRSSLECLHSDLHTIVKP